jgi:hypothetical protein
MDVSGSILANLDAGSSYPKPFKVQTFKVQRPLPQPGTRNAEPGTAKQLVGMTKFALSFSVGESLNINGIFPIA